MRIASSLPESRRPSIRFSERSRHIDSGAPRAAYDQAPDPHPPAARARRSGRRRAARLGLRDEHRRRRPRARPLHPEVRRLPRTRRGRDDGDRSAPTSTKPSPPRAKRARAAKRSKAWSKPRSSRRGRATATPPSRCPPRRRGPGPRRRRRLRRHVRRRARARRRPRSRAGRARRSSPTTAAAAATPWRRPRPAATTGPNLDEVLPGPEHGDDRRVDRGPQRDDRQGLPRERDARHLRRNPEPEGNRTARRIPDRGNRRRKRPPRARRPRAAEPSTAPWRAAGIIHPMRERFEITPQLYAKVTLVALAGLSLIVLTGAGVRLTGSGLGCPDWPKCYGQSGASARHPRGDRVRQPAADRLRRARRDRRRGPRLLPPPLPLAPGAVRRAAADGGHGTGDPRRAGGQVPPRPGAGDEPLHPLDAAPRRLLRARLVLALRALGAGRAPPTGSASGPCGR